MTPPTERRNPRTTELDQLRARAIVDLMNTEEAQALRAVEAVADELARAAELVAESHAAGGRTAYIGAGTSGLLALLDAIEVPSTFGIDSGRFFALIATGVADGRAIVATSEDEADAAVAAVDNAALGAGDVVVGLAASGTTPFAVAGVEHARRRGCHTIGIANNPATPLLRAAEMPILLDTGPEVVTGSTRLKAGTAQKLALNRISTAAMVLTGKVVSNLMVEVRPSTEKLRQRAVRIVRDLADVDEPTARAALERSSWSVRDALQAVGVSDD